MKFKDRLNQAMIENGFTATDLCNRTGIPKSAMSQYRSGAFEPKADRLKAIADALGKTDKTKVKNLVNILDGYFKQGAQHINVNVLNREKLIDAMNNPNKYPNLTIRVSGYAVNFNKLSKAHQQEVISRTFHGKM